MSSSPSLQICSPVSDSDFDNDFYDTVSDGKVIVYTCKAPDCKKAFRFKSEIQRHLTTHSSLRPHACKFPNCTKSFKRKDALQNHMRTHTNEKPYACSSLKCKMRFATRAGLRYHMLKHQGEKLFKCQEPGCESEFWTLAQLTKHEASSVHNGKSNSDGTSEDSAFQSEEKFDICQFEIPMMAAPNMMMNNASMMDLMKIFRENELLKRRVEENEKMISMLQNKTNQISYINSYQQVDNSDLFGMSADEGNETFFGYNY